MEVYSNIIESLSIKFAKANQIDVLKPVIVDNFYDVANTVIFLNKGTIAFGPNNEKLGEGDILFIPSGQSINITYGSGKPLILSNEDLTSRMDKYLASSIDNSYHERFVFLAFDAKVFDSVNFFQSLDIPAFKIQNNDCLHNIIKDIVNEGNHSGPGSERMVQLNTERLAIEIIRHIMRNEMFQEQLNTNTVYFRDPRLLEIFTYIKENLDGDLTNRALSHIANVSEDYVGQYFKMLTGTNPQDYIEYQRMERAVSLLRTTKLNIRDIGQKVGYKDTAYFCRRFKMMFGVSAGKMRRRESMLNL